ncbi:MAG: hypothetical protein IPO60_08240 [Flavobacteriales bacterium]|nr:hypothetical protein [Flavobacteriales bacterium]
MGFSGGEKKRNEHLPDVHARTQLNGILDETDSGLDIDAISHRGLRREQTAHRRQRFIVVTHYPSACWTTSSDVVRHVMADVKINKSGPKELALELRRRDMIG